MPHHHDIIDILCQGETLLITTSGDHGFAPDDPVTIADVVPVGWNEVTTVAAVPEPNQLVVPCVAHHGTYIMGGQVS